MLSIFCSLPQHTICFIMWYYNFTAMWCDLSAGRTIMVFLLWRCDPTRVMASSFLRFSRSHTTTHHSRQDSCRWVISSSQRPLPDNTQHSKQTNIHTSGGIRTHDLSRRAAADLRLRPRGYWDRRYPVYSFPYWYSRFTQNLYVRKENVINILFSSSTHDLFYNVILQFYSDVMRPFSRP